MPSEHCAGGELLIRFSPDQQGFVVIDETQTVLAGPFTRLDYAIGIAHSLATKHGATAVHVDAEEDRVPHRAEDDSSVVHHEQSR